ncbi:MAG: hypothetical protein KGP01_02655 [Actinomycetales bacterium]|nr:hypothetical protein [Actinomycetales bacterium]
MESGWLQGDALLAAMSAPTVMDACAEAQAEVDALLKTPPLRRPGSATGAAVAALREHAAHGSSALMGADLSLSTFRAVRGDGSPLASTVAVAESLLLASVRDARTFADSPLRALAAWHVLATGHGGIDPDTRGRPRLPGSPVRHDPLNTGIEPADVSAIVQHIVALSTGLAVPSTPAVVVASSIHALIAVGQPFAEANAVIGRAAARAVLVARGADPDGLTAYEASIAASGRPAYVTQLRALAYADSAAAAHEAWCGWLVWHCGHIAAAANRAARDLSEGAPPGP